ncbi:MAG TPA: cytosine permease [Mycobacteriales bacterium]|nr:cytosine permease [Mycobacteriales bacterium]
MTVVDAPATRPERRLEAALTLAEPAPRALGLLDQVGLWANLGVSLLGTATAVFVLQPGGFRPLSLLAALVAVVVGTLIGSLALGLSTVPGAQTGAPAMVLLRGLFGARLSYLPTTLNVLQCIGWGVFEIVVIAQAAEQLLPWHHARVTYVVAAGVLTTMMTLRPLGSVRVLRRYAIAGVAISTTYLFVQLLRHPLPPLSRGSWSGFWISVDTVIAVSVSWVPLSSDYSRHSRSPRKAFGGAVLGYTTTQIVFYALGLVALATVVHVSSDQARLFHDMFGAFLAVPLGWLAFGVLILRELDQSFADTYSTVVSVQNVRPLADRRVLAVAVGAVATGLALALHIAAYQDFLLLIGSVFVPMFAVFVVDYFVFARGRPWDTSTSAPARWSRLAPWLGGFAVYQLINPGAVSWWVSGWTRIAGWLHFTPASWMSASLCSFFVAGALTLVIGALTGRRRVASG